MRTLDNNNLTSRTNDTKAYAWNAKRRYRSNFQTNLLIHKNTEIMRTLNNDNLTNRTNDTKAFVWNAKR